MLKDVLFVGQSAAGSTAKKCVVGGWRFLILAGFVGASVGLAPCAVAGDVNGEGWRTDFEAAEAQAKTQGVPMVVHFHAHWCGPCRAMDSEVLETAEVRSALQSGIVGVKVNADNRKDLVARFGISALPTDVIVSPEGRVLTKNVGSPGRTAYVARLAQYRVSEKAPSHSGESAIAQAADRSEKSQVTQVSQQQVIKVAPTSSSTADTEIVAIDNSEVESTNAVPDSDRSAASAVTSLTKALRRDSDKRIGLHGYSPVSLTESETWKTGNADYKYEYQGVSYQLSSAEELERFRADPGKFIPALHGCDPVALVNDQIVQAGHIELGVTWRSRVYFFYSKETRDQFLSDPERFVRLNNLTFFSGESQG